MNPVFIIQKGEELHKLWKYLSKEYKIGIISNFDSLITPENLKKYPGPFVSLLSFMSEEFSQYSKIPNLSDKILDNYLKERSQINKMMLEPYEKAYEKLKSLNKSNIRSCHSMLNRFKKI